ncbi:MAG: DUF2075 domain-containing protein, partial [Bacteroidaceae bacterium]|nr:DUF2075 domain-containing protein [Bacteroidaceae bacterium]
WKNQYQVTLKDWPSEVEDFLRKKIKEGEKSVRFLSSYTEKWDSKGILNPDHGTCSEFDFILKDKDGREFRKFWNSTYEAFVQNVLGSTMCNDPLSEVGCPYVVRGFDYTWIGLLWLKDYIYRKELGGWCISFKYVKESAIETIKKSAKKEWETLPASVRRKYTFEGEPLFSESMTGCPMIARLFKAQKQAYRILMTRAMKGMCIYIQDEETRNYVKSLLK